MRALVLVTLVGCSSVPPAVQAEGAYGAELAACVEGAATLAESKACRAKVKGRWGLDGGAK